TTAGGERNDQLKPVKTRTVNARSTVLWIIVDYSLNSSKKRVFYGQLFCRLPCGYCGRPPEISPFPPSFLVDKSVEYVENNWQTGLLLRGAYGIKTGFSWA